MKALRSLITTLVGCAVSMTAMAAQPGWQPVETPQREPASASSSSASSLSEGDAPDIEVTMAPGEVVVTVSRPVVVKVFTILGQLISQETLKAGTHRLRLPSKGVYILRAGGVTRRLVG